MIAGEDGAARLAGTDLGARAGDAAKVLRSPCTGAEVVGAVSG